MIPRLLCLAWLVVSVLSCIPAQASPKTASTWPREYTVTQDDVAGRLILQTPYYSMEHDLKKGGVLSRITLRYGRSPNLLVRPVETRVRDAQGKVWSDVNDPNPNVTYEKEDLNEIVKIECGLMGEDGRASGMRVRTTLEYRWGYVKIFREILPTAKAVQIREVSPFTTMLAPSLNEFGYREGITEEEKAPPFSFGSNRWGKSQPGQPHQGRYVPRSMIFVNRGVEGLEWFVGSDLAEWELQPAGRRGQGLWSLEHSEAPSGLSLSISPYWSTNSTLSISNDIAFHFYLAVPLLEGHAWKPWIHTSFNRNKGNWVSTQEIQRWAEQGYQTVHCHNDGDYYDDGLFWRDGAYPPYPDMERYDKVLRDCRRSGIRTATYFSNKELHPSTQEFKEDGTAWGRMNRKGALQHNIFKGTNEFGVQMCLRSGWLGFLKHSIDRVLKNHPLDGVYYDWNVALYCANPLHEHGRTNGPALGHWDMDELIDLMEWTRQRVGPNGLVIIHNTTTPMFVTENFSDHIVATEWGYGKWTDRAPDLDALPLEWSLAGARSRGVISYGSFDEKAPRRLHKLFAIEAFLGGSSPWPASPEALELLNLLKPVGKFESCRFADWRNEAVKLSDKRCASAIYSRPGESYLLLANLEAQPREVLCQLQPERLPFPLRAPIAATVVGGMAKPAPSLNIRQMTKEGAPITLPGDSAILVHIR